MSRTRIAQIMLAVVAASALVACGASAAEPQTDAPTHPAETLNPLFSEQLPNVPGKTFTSAIVAFPPAARAVPHRHGDAFVYAYVLEGAVSSEIEGQPPHVYRQGENWSEEPGAHHLATENTSATQEAKLLVVFVATTGQELKVDDPHG